MSDGAAYFLETILSSAMLTIASFAPTPEKPLTPTIVPFPDAEVSEVALWFVTEWWLAKGAFLFEARMLEKH